MYLHKLAPFREHCLHRYQDYIFLRVDGEKMKSGPRDFLEFLFGLMGFGSKMTWFSGPSASAIGQQDYLFSVYLKVGIIFSNLWDAIGQKQCDGS